jgi:hypothetical protein
MRVSEPAALDGVAREEMVTVPLAGSQSELERGEDFRRQTHYLVLRLRRARIQAKRVS